MLSRLERLNKEQRGITGLETAIILIAFVVVASVFAYTVLSAGIFSSEKAKEAIHSGLDTVRSSAEVVGPVLAKDNHGSGNVDQIIFTLGNSMGGRGVDLTTTTDSNSNGLLSDEATQNNTTVVSYLDKNQVVDDIAWTTTQIGKGDDDSVLDPGEKIEVTVDVSHLSPRMTKYSTFQIEVKPSKGSAVTIERTIPPVVDAIVDLR